MKKELKKIEQKRLNPCSNGMLIEGATENAKLFDNTYVS